MERLRENSDGLPRRRSQGAGAAGLRRETRAAPGRNLVRRPCRGLILGALLDLFEDECPGNAENGHKRPTSEHRRYRNDIRPKSVTPATEESASAESLACLLARRLRLARVPHGRDLSARPQHSDARVRRHSSHGDPAGSGFCGGDPFPGRDPDGYSGRSRGKRIDSRIPTPVSSMTRRSTPIPMPPAGGIPYSMALRKTSSSSIASGSP